MKTQLSECTTEAALGKKGGRPILFATVWLESEIPSIVTRHSTIEGALRIAAREGYIIVGRDGLPINSDAREAWIEEGLAAIKL